MGSTRPPVVCGMRSARRRAIDLLDPYRSRFSARIWVPPSFSYSDEASLLQVIGLCELRESLRKKTTTTTAFGARVFVPHPLPWRTARARTSEQTAIICEIKFGLNMKLPRSPADLRFCLNSAESKGVAGAPLEKGVSHTEHIDLNQNLQAK